MATNLFRPPLSFQRRLESRRGGRGGVKEWQTLPDAHVRLSCLLSFPLCGNGLFQPLDSGVRRNDGRVDSGLRRAATGILGGLFPTPLYRLRPVGVPSRRIQDFLGGSFPTPLYHLHLCRRVHK